MTSRTLPLFAALLVLPGWPVATLAEEPFDEVGKLRGGGRFQAAFELLQQIRKDESAPAEVRAQVTYESARTLLAQARRTRDPREHAARLHLAERDLRQFLEEHPKHEKAAEANARLGRLLLDRAERDIVRSRSPANRTRKAELRVRARRNLVRSREVLQEAHDRYEAEYESFAKFIDPDDPKYEQRTVAEYHYLRAQLDLALCTYQEAQTYEEDALERDGLLEKAAAEFSRIHAEHRSQVAGLYARMWQAKCHEESGKLRKADGIYNELLGHGERLRRENKPVPKSLKSLTDQVLQFKLSLLNRPGMKNYLLAHLESQAWLDEPANLRSRTETALGIRWESCVARVKLAEGESGEKRQALLRGALEEARLVARYRTAWQWAAKEMVTRLEAKLSDAPTGSPNDGSGTSGPAH